MPSAAGPSEWLTEGLDSFCFDTEIVDHRRFFFFLGKSQKFFDPIKNGKFS